jgi:glycine cleavage system T protein (aminomethyltransferase)
MPKHTPLYDEHVAAGAKLVDFSGWEMPLNYGSQLEEHHAVRQAAGVFDVSHMTVLDVRGAATRSWLQGLVANDVAKLITAGKALYTCMLTEDGGVIDDLIIYYMADDWYRVVLNAGTHDKDMAWLTRHAEGIDNLDLLERPELAMLAVQGPKALDAIGSILTTELAVTVKKLAPFQACNAGDMFIGRTGYTGEDGVEVILPGEAAASLWRDLLAAGVRPIGLGARDSLRLEAGMALYGSDMDETTSPLESGLGWTVAWQPEERDFIGRDALQQQKQQGVARRMIGLLLEDRGVLRSHMPVRSADGGTGETCSGSFSPTLGRSIALARVPASVKAGDECEVEIRGHWLKARAVKYPFVRNGESCIEL